MIDADKELRMENSRRIHGLFPDPTTPLRQVDKWAGSSNRSQTDRIEGLLREIRDLLKGQS